MIIDFHTHIFPPEVCRDRQRFLEGDAWFGELYANPKARLALADDLIASMDAAGVDRAVTFGFAWTDAGFCREANDYVIDSVARFPDRLIGFISVNPRRPEEAQREIERCVAKGLAGIGELMPDAQGFALDETKTMAPLVEAARHYHLPILAHTSEPVGHTYPGKGTKSLQTVVRFAEHFPDVVLVCAHWGGGLFFYELMPELMRTLKNVYYDTAASLCLYRDRIFHVAAALTRSKVLFATDYPLLSHRRFLKHVRASGLSAAAERDLLGGNAQRVLALAEGAVVQGQGNSHG